MTVTDLLWHGLLTTFWVSVLTILVLMLRKPVTERLGARAAMLLWMIPLGRLLMPTLPRIVPVEPASPTPAPAPAPLWVEPKIEAAPAAMPDPKPLVVEVSEPVATSVVPQTVEAAKYDWTDVAGYVEPEPASASSLDLAAMDIMSMISMPTAEQMAALVVILWAMGAMLCGVLCWLRVRMWRETILAEAQPTPRSLQPVIDRASSRVGIDQSFDVVVSAAADTPQLLGVKRPIVALPPEFIDDFSPEEQEMALTHEFVHLKRGDLMIMLATEAATAIQWFNPLAGKVKRAVRDDQEAACDETVRSLGFCKHSYAALLVKAARHGRAVPALTLDHSLKDRIILMTSPISSPIVRIFVAVTAILGSAGIAAATASYTEVAVELREAEDLEEALDGADNTWEPAPQERSKGESGKASYWDRYGSDSRDDHLYTSYDKKEEREVEFESRVEFHKADDGKHETVFWQDEMEMVLLSDPFAAITPPENFPSDVPVPPEPVIPEIEIEERKVEGGRWIFVPDEPDMSAFEDAMKAFEKEMSDWSARMEDFGKRMEVTGEAVGDLAKRCSRHTRYSDRPTILSQSIEGSSDKVRAVCASGGLARFRSGEISSYLKSQRLSEDEIAHFEESIRHRG